MSTQIPATTDGSRQQLEELISKLMRGERDSEAGKHSRERMDRMREATRQRIGTIDVAIDLIRELRDR